MGGKNVKPLPIITESAKEVLSRRSNLPPRGILGPTKPPKPILEEYNEKIHNDMTKVLNIKTITIPVSDMVKKGSKNSAHLIRYHKDKQIEEDKSKGIIKGRAQLSEDELISLFEMHRELENQWEPSVMAKELNVTVDEVLELIKSTRLPLYRQLQDGNLEAY